jgi:hypothetical protein
MTDLLRAWSDLPDERVAYTIQHVPMDALRAGRGALGMEPHQLFERILGRARAQARRVLPDLGVNPSELITVTYLDRMHRPVRRNEEAALLRLALYMTTEDVEKIPA